MEAVVRQEGHGIVNFDETAMSAQGVLKQVTVIQDVMKLVMKDGQHYGVIPGTDKPSLLKPGAEKLGLTFRLAPEYDVTVIELPRDHREYRVKCRLFHIPTGAMVGEGVGTCSTMESKWRYISDFEWTGRTVPKEFWKDRDVALIGGKGFVAKKNQEGQWEVAHIAGKVERDNPADCYNTCEKMAKKRAHVDAILTATAASDIFTQDVEDILDNEAQSASGNGKSKAQGDSPSPPQKNDSGGSEKHIQDRLADELGEYCNHDLGEAAELLKGLTMFKDKDGNTQWMKLEKIDKVSDKWAAKTLHELHELKKKRDAEGPDADHTVQE